MASSSSLLLSPISSTTIENRDLCSNYAAAFLRNSKLVVSTKPRRSSASRRCGFRSPVAQKSYDHIPKQFRQENIKDGWYINYGRLLVFSFLDCLSWVMELNKSATFTVVMDNYKNTPQYLYGLTPSQIDMFMTKDSPVRRQAEKITDV